MKNQYKKDYWRAKEIYDSLTDQEKHWVSPRGEFIDSDKILFREIMQSEKGQDAGFIDVYEFNNDKKIGFIVMAVHPDFRSQGYSRRLRTSAIENCKRFKMRKLIYRCDVENIGSLRSIKKDKRFTFVSKDNTHYIYEIDLDKYKEDDPEDFINEANRVPLVFSNENEFFGVEEFKAKKLNMCFVTGMSGGGKSTFAEKLAKEANADVICLDNIEAKDKWKYKNNPTTRSLYWIFKWCDENGYTEENDNEFVHLGHVKFLRWLRTQESKTNRFVVEGVQIPWMFHVDSSVFKNAAWVLINTSVATSISRRYNRDKDTSYGFSINSLPRMIRLYMDWYVTQNKLRNDLPEFLETTGPAASGPVVGMEKNLVFVSQYGSKNSKAKVVEGYAVSNDMITKNIIVTDNESGKLKKVPYSYLEGREITMFEVKDKSNGMKKILSEVGNPHTKNFIYEAITGKELLSDDQILCEEGFTQINPIDMGAEVISEIQSMFSDYKKPPEFELMNEKYIQEADRLLDGIDDIVILENQHGFFAKNTKTGKRTGYFKHIKDIPVKVVKNIKRR